MRNLKEESMYEPIRNLLEEEGFHIQTEVGHADIVGEKAGEMIIVEMKTSFSLKLVYQVIERQRVTENVYAAIPLDYKKLRSRSYKDMVKLLKRLGVGLIVVHVRRRGMEAEIVFNPGVYTYNKSHVKKGRIVKEIKERSDTYNSAGITGQKLITAYREKAIHVACLLMERGPLSTKVIREETENPKVTKILQDNHYGWFNRVSRGVYEFVPDKTGEVQSFEAVFAYYLKKVTSDD